jgi:hypothetical protein
MVTIPMQVLDKRVEIKIGILDEGGVELCMNNITNC